MDQFHSCRCGVRAHFALRGSRDGGDASSGSNGSRSISRGRRHAHHLLVLLVGVSIGAQRVQVWVLQSLVLERVKAMAYQFGHRSCNANEVLRNRAQCANAKLQIITRPALKPKSVALISQGEALSPRPQTPCNLQG